MPERFGVLLVALDQDVTAEICDAFQFARKVHGFFPAGDGLRRVLADAADAEQFAARGGEDGGRIAEMLQQLPHPHWPDPLNHVQGHECLLRLHVAR